MTCVAYPVPISTLISRVPDVKISVSEQSGVSKIGQIALIFCLPFLKSDMITLKPISLDLVKSISVFY